MRNFKKFTASILAYFMLISLIPSSIVENVAKASENDYAKLVKQGYYLKSNAQYDTKTLITYKGSGVSDKDLYVALVENGKETILKTEKNCDSAIITSDNSSKVVIMYLYKDKDTCYEIFDFKTLEFKSITKDEYDMFVENINLYPSGYSSTLVQSMDQDRDTVIEEALSKINQYNDGYNLTISDKEFLFEGYGLVYINDDDYLDIYARKINVYNEDLKVSIDAITLSIQEINAGNEAKNYKAVVTDNDAYIEEVSEYDYDDFKLGDYDGYYSLFLSRDLDYETQRLIEITNGNIVTNQVVDFGNRSFNKIGDKIYIQDYMDNILKIYEKQDEEYKLSGEVESLISKLRYLKAPKLPSLIQKEDSKVYFSQIVDGNLVKRVDITDEIDKFNGQYGLEVNIQGDCNDNYILENTNTFVIIQKVIKKEEVPETPEVPGKPVVPETPQSPEEDVVIEEVPEINPNDENKVEINAEEIKNVEVVVKDIEAIKNGTGSLNIAINNELKMNLPLSIIDKSLLEGAESVSVKLNVEEDSEITKELKAVNKVFDFNLVVNKEDGEVKIHNFSDGLAEITFALTDEDLEGLNRDNLVVYYYNEETKEFEEMETKVQGTNVTFKTPHFSKYIISEKIVDDSTKPEVDNTKPEVDNTKPEVDNTKPEVDNTKPEVDNTTTDVDNTTTDKDEEITNTTDSDNTTKEENEEVTITPDEDDNEENTTETGSESLPETGAVVSNNVILAIAIGIVLVGTAILFRRKKVA